MNKKQQVAVVFGLIISIVFLWGAFRDLQPEAVLDVLGDVKIGWLLFGAVFYFLAVTVIALRWGFLLRADLRLWALFPLVAIGYMGNNVYPFRSGEVLRVFLLDRNHKIPFFRGATTVLIERVFDGLVMLTFILVGLLLTDIASKDVQRVVTFAAPLFLFASAMFFLLAARPGILRRILNLVAALVPGRIGEMVHGMADDIVAGLEGLRSPLDLFGAVVSSYVTWALEAGVYWIVSAAFGLDIGYPLMLLVVGAVNLAGLIPASPGQIGVFEFFASTVLIAAGVDDVLALSYAITVHLVIWLPVTLVGFGFLIQQGLNWKAITQAHQLEEQANTSAESHMTSETLT